MQKQTRIPGLGPVGFNSVGARAGLQNSTQPARFGRPSAPESRPDWYPTRALLFGWNTAADAPVFLERATASVRATPIRRRRCEPGTSGFARHGRRPHPVCKNLTAQKSHGQMTSMGFVETVIGHQRRATSKSRDARLIPTACRHELFNARRSHADHGKPAAKGLSSRRKLS